MTLIQSLPSLGLTSPSVNTAVARVGDLPTSSITEWDQSFCPSRGVLPRAPL